MKGIGFVRLLSIGKEGTKLNSSGDLIALARSMLLLGWELQVRETVWSMDQDQNFTAMVIEPNPQRCGYGIYAGLVAAEMKRCIWLNQFSKSNTAAAVRNCDEPVREWEAVY